MARPGDLVNLTTDFLCAPCYSYSLGSLPGCSSKLWLLQQQRLLPAMTRLETDPSKFQSRLDNSKRFESVSRNSWLMTAG